MNNNIEKRLINNPETRTMYQQFSIDPLHYEQFIRLIHSRRQLKHHHLMIIKNHWKKYQKPKNNPLEISCNHNPKI